MFKSLRIGKQRTMEAMFSNKCLNKMTILRRSSNFWSSQKADIPRSSQQNRGQSILERRQPLRCSKDLDSANLSINPTTLDSGRPVKDTARAPMYSPMALYTKDSGLRIS